MAELVGTIGPKSYMPGSNLWEAGDFMNARGDGSLARLEIGLGR